MLNETKEDLLRLAKIVAVQTICEMFPALDEVKLREAYIIAGSRKWLDYHIRKGNIKPTRKGTAKNSPRYFSRAEIVALREAEKRINHINF